MVLYWGLVIAAFGTLSLFFGTMAALIQHDSSACWPTTPSARWATCSLGFGIGLGLAVSDPTSAAVGLIGGLFHLINHACFKGLLFLNAGTFEYATGERDLNQLGGMNRPCPSRRRAPSWPPLHRGTPALQRLLQQVAPLPRLHLGQFQCHPSRSSFRDRRDFHLGRDARLFSSSSWVPRSGAPNPLL